MTFHDPSVGIAGRSTEGPHSDLAEGPVSSCIPIYLGR